MGIQKSIGNYISENNSQYTALLTKFPNHRLQVTEIRRTLDYVSTQLAFTCSKLTIETLEQGVKYVQS